MLNIEKQEIINGCVVYQDYTDPNSFYCLPKEKAKIADDGKGIQYVVYTDNEILEDEDPDFDKDESRVGGFLTLQVELGPSDDEFEAIKSELESKYGDGITLSMVPFTDGGVKLVVFASDGSSEGNTDDFKVTIAGSTKPSLNLKQIAVFSTRLSNKPAQIMWNLLKKGGQTQASVVYDLSYLGIMKAYNLEIEVDFKATEDFWNHSFNLKAGVNTDSVKIAASANVDVMIRELMNEGAIKVKETVYASGEAQTNLLGNDKTGIELVKKLMGPTLFEATAIPSDDYSAAINESIADRIRDGEGGDADGPPGGDGQDDAPTTDDSSGGAEENGGGEGDNDEGSSTDGEGGEGSGDGQEGDNNGVEGTVTPEDRPEGETETDEGGGSDESAENQEGTDSAPESSGDEETEETPSPEVRPPVEGGDESEEEDGNENADDDTKKEGTSNAFDVDINVGYTYKRREISQQVKRTFVFNKAEAKTIKYHPNGALSVENTSFNADKQIQLVRLGDGPFKEIELEVRASFDFDEYDIREAIVHISYGYKGDEGDKSKRVHEHSLTLDKTNLSDKIKFFVDEYGTLSYDYYVEFIHNAGSIIGSPETKVTSQVFEDETKRDLSINMDTHSPLIPVEIQTGELQFEDSGIQSVQVFLAPKKDANGRTTILKKGSTALKRYLIHPPEENQYDYYVRQEFFFKDEKLIFEEENIKDSQVVIDRPLARILSITPNLATTHKLVKQALIDIRYIATDTDEKRTTLNLTPETPSRSFAVLVEESDPRNWMGRSRFVLNDGRLLEGDWVTYDTEQPFINLDNSGFRTVKVATLLGDTTFSGRIIAMEITLESMDEEFPGSTVLFLNQTQIEQIAIIPDIPPTVALNASVRVFSNDGTVEELTFMVPPNAPLLMLPITTIN